MPKVFIEDAATKIAAIRAISDSVEAFILHHVGLTHTQKAYLLRDLSRALLVSKTAVDAMVELEEERAAQTA